MINDHRDFDGVPSLTRFRFPFFFLPALPSLFHKNHSHLRPILFFPPASEDREKYLLAFDERFLLLLLLPLLLLLFPPLLPFLFHPRINYLVNSSCTRKVDLITLAFSPIIKVTFPFIPR